MFVWLLTPGLLYAGIDPSETAGSRPAALGYAYTAVNGEFWSLFHNPAGIAGIKNPGSGIFFSRYFNLPQLTRSQAGFVLPTGENQAAGLSVRSFGFDAWRESALSFAYAVSFFGKISLGTRVSWLSLATPDAGRHSTFLSAVGTQVKVNDQVFLGFAIANANQAALRGTFAKAEISSVFSAGLCFRPSEKVLLSADVKKPLDFPVSWAGGLEYSPGAAIRLRCGFTTYPLSFCGGLGLEMDKIDIDFSLNLHESLGYTPSLSLNYHFLKN
ncbi:MAG: hypothetical protein R3C61_14105 [Bacteroidia bacterium]